MNERKKKKPSPSSPIQFAQRYDILPITHSFSCPYARLSSRGGGVFALSETTLVIGEPHSQRRSLPYTFGGSKAPGFRKDCEFEIILLDVECSAT